MTPLWHSYSLISLSLAVAMLLSVISWYEPWGMWWPAWPLLVIIYWCLMFPSRVGIFSAWIYGLIIDGTQGGVLGQNALCLSLVAYICLLSHQRWRHFTPLQLTGPVALLVAVHQLTGFWLESIIGRGNSILPWLTIALASVPGWLLIFPVLNRLAHPLLVARH